MEISKTQMLADQDLLAGLRGADNQIIQQIYDLALPSVIHWVQENNGSEADARDIFQEALLVVYRKLREDNFTLTCTLKSYLRIVCRNLWLTRLRNRKTKQLSPLEGVEMVDLGEDVLHKIEQSKKIQLYYHHFDQLGEQCQQILRWFFTKVSLKEIAKRMDSSEGYIKKKKFLCKEKLVRAIQTDRLWLNLCFWLLSRGNISMQQHRRF